MEVHPPHQTVHTWRDFATHLTIVTIGLFIALSLEAFVEYMHHRHIVHEARENIRRELEDNHQAALDDFKSLQQNMDRESANIRTIQFLRTRPKDFHGSVVNRMDFNSMDDAAWRTARDTGALAYMPYDEVQRYSGLYMLASLVNDNATTAAQADFLAAAPFQIVDDPKTLPDSDLAQMLHANAEVKIRLLTLYQLTQQLDVGLLKELKK